jgi:hydrogenase-4 component E
MTTLSDILAALLLLTNLGLLASSRLAACIRTAALQGVILGLIILTRPPARPDAAVVAVALSTVILKGLVLPWLLRRAVRGVGAVREIEPFVGAAASVLIGAVLFATCVLIAEPLQASAPAGVSPMMIPTAMFTILTGLFVICSRRKALTQVLGYLVMENGVCVFGSALAVEAPLPVELGVLLDVSVAVFVMGIVIFHINREFDHIDTDRLSILRD